MSERKIIATHIEKGRLDMKLDIVRAWKDEAYRQQLSSEEQALLPANPAGELELSDADLQAIHGAIKCPVEMFQATAHEQGCNQTMGNNSGCATNGNVLNGCNVYYYNFTLGLSLLPGTCV
jgi:mersacidin/lichenicidin family type 2 lantibiotic